MRRFIVPLVAAVATAGLVLAGCTQAAPAPTPTKAPAAPTKAAEPTKPAAAATAAPTKAAAPQPTAAPVKKVDFPQKGKSITLMTPWAAGGGTDIQGRVTAPALEKELGVAVQVVNKPGGGTAIGLAELAKAKPDGYYFGMTNLPSTLMTYIDPEKKVGFTRKDFVAVANQVVDPAAIAVDAKSPYKTIKDLVDAAKANPDKLKMSTAGVLTNTHLDLISFQKAAGIKTATVHFDGGSQATTALLGGHIDASSQTAGNYAEQVRASQVRILAIMDRQRSKFFPNVPTMTEAGYNLVAISSRGYAVPAGTPKEIVDVLSAAIKKAMESPDVVKRMDDMALEQRYMDATAFGALWDQMERDAGPLLEMAKQQQ